MISSASIRGPWQYSDASVVISDSDEAGFLRNYPSYEW